MSDHHVALFGNTAIGRAFCESCRTFAFVLDGRLQCCNKLVDFTPSAVKRVSEPEKKRRRPALAERHKILNAQDHRCLYCEQIFGSTVQVGIRVQTLMIRWDHVDPYCYSFNNQLGNFAAACQFCNAWKSGLTFRSIEEIKIYVRDKWDGLVCVAAVRQELPKTEAVAEVLQPAVQGPLLEPQKSTSQELSSKPGRRNGRKSWWFRSQAKPPIVRQIQPTPCITYPISGHCFVCRGDYEICSEEDKGGWQEHHPACFKAFRKAMAKLAKVLPPAAPQRKRPKPNPALDPKKSVPTP